MAINVAVIGECMIELSENQANIVRHFGGDTLNTAVYLTRANPNLSVHYVSALGTDPMSSAMLEQWQKEGVHTELVQRLDNKLPGLYLINTDNQGERTFHYWRNDAAARYWLRSPKAPMICQQLLDFDYIYLSGISLAILSPEDRELLLQQLAKCREKGVKIAFDNNYRARLWESLDAAQKTYQAVLSLTDLAFLTLDDEFLLWGDSEEAQCVSRTIEFGVGEIVIKKGAEPCLIIQQGHCDEVPAIKLDKQSVIDTTAAGDSFSAGYLATRLAGESVVMSARYAHLLASTVIQHRGAIIPIVAMPHSSIKAPLIHSTRHTMSTLLEQLSALKIIPVIAIKNADDVVALGKALVENGMPSAEITFRTPAAAEAIRQLRNEFPKMIICAGTVLTKAQVDQAIEAGADFIVSPGFNPRIVQYCQQRGIPIIPGINTPSLVEEAMELGIKLLKFFPAELSGGIGMLKALSAVYPVSFMPTGGVNANNVKDYLALPRVVACGGTWMVPSDLVDNQKWEEIGALAKEAMAAL